jgi:hypothetical protein
VRFSNEVARVTARARFVTWLRSSLVTVESVVVVGGVALLVVIQIPWFEGLLDRIGLGDTPEVIQAILIAVLASLFLQWRELQRGVEELLDRQSLRVHFSDPFQVYPHLLERCLAIGDSKHKQLDVLGLTLFTALPFVEFWLMRPELNGWEITMALIDPDTRAAEWIHNRWPDESRRALASVIDASKRGDIVARGIRLTAIAYDFAPAVHGFRIGTGDVYLATLRWEADGRLGVRGMEYEFIPAHDRSDSARAARALFDSWFQRALDGGRHDRPDATTSSES